MYSMVLFAAYNVLMNIVNKAFYLILELITE